MADSKVEALGEALDHVVASKGIALKDVAKLKKLKQNTKERRAYNQMWPEAKKLFDAKQTEELQMYLEGVEESFKTTEKKYNDVVAKKAEQEKNPPKL